MPRPAKPRWSKSRNRWYACVGEPGPDGRAREVFAPPGLGPKDEGRAWEWLRGELARRSPGPATAAELTVDGLAELYVAWAETRVADGKLSREHFTSKRYHLDKLRTMHGARPALALGHEEMDAFVRAIAAAYSAHYAANICGTVSAAFNWAVKKGHLPRSPIAGFEAPHVPHSPERFAEKSVAAEFLRGWRRHAHRHGRFRRDGAPIKAARVGRLTILMQRCIMRTGARPGELCALRWDHLDWRGGTSKAGHPWAKGVLPHTEWKSGRKTGKARTIYFSPALTRALRREYGRPDRHPTHVFWHGAGRGGAGEASPWSSGSVLSKTILKARRTVIAEQAARAAAGKPIGPELVDSGPGRVVNYLWRHTAASTLLMMGLDVSTVAELLGTSPEMVRKHYGHLLDRHLAAAAEHLH